MTVANKIENLVKAREIKISHVIATEDAKNCADSLHPITGKGVYSGKIIEELQSEYPGQKLVIMRWSEYVEKHDKAFTTSPVQVSKKTFVEMLNVLPPERWEQANGWNIFSMCEYWSGNITAFYVRHKGKYWTLNQHARIDLDEIRKLVTEAEANA